MKFTVQECRLLSLQQRIDRDSVQDEYPPELTFVRVLYGLWQSTFVNDEVEISLRLRFALDADC